MKPINGYKKEWELTIKNNEAITGFWQGSI